MNLSTMAQKSNNNCTTYHTILNPEKSKNEITYFLNFCEKFVYVTYVKKRIDWQFNVFAFQDLTDLYSTFHVCLRARTLGCQLSQVRATITKTKRYKHTRAERNSIEMGDKTSLRYPTFRCVTFKIKIQFNVTRIRVHKRCSQLFSKNTVSQKYLKVKKIYTHIGDLSFFTYLLYI